MSTANQSGVSRRDMMKSTGTIAAASALAGVALPQVHAGGDETIKIALVGCGGRGTGAATNALRTEKGATQLVAMADVFTNRLANSHQSLQRDAAQRRQAQQVDVPEARRYIGFNAYRQAMDALRPGDVVILTTPPAFRWVQFKYAIEKRLNVFMEKPITVDGPSTRRMLELAAESERAGIKVGVGLMCRHCEARGELFRRIKDGAIGDLTLLRAYRLHAPVATFNSLAKPDGISELMYQIQRFHSFIWASGGCFSDFYIHNLDECCWMKDAFPVEAQASGGRHYKTDRQGRPFIDQNFDSYSVEYTFADGAKLFLEGRCMDGCHGQFASLAHGTRGSAVISTSGHAPSRCRLSRTQKPFNPADITWRAAQNEPDPYQLEWEHLMQSIRRNERHNEVRRGAEASLACVMGRMAAHTGQVITREQALNSDHELAPEVERLTLDGPAPLRLRSDGKYPVPQPGIRPQNSGPWREYYV
jgi:predicted dehydrogenase